MVPTQEQIETTSTNYWGLRRNREDSFLRNYNNLIFLQVEKKKNHSLHSKHRKSRNAVPKAIVDAAKTLKFGSGSELFFKMMDENTNGFAGLTAFMKFYRYSALYLEIDSMVQ